MIFFTFLNKKYLLVLIVFIVIVISSAVIWLILSLEYQPNNNGPSHYPSHDPEQSQPETQISETKTYRNEKFGFEFQYPVNLILKEKVFGSYYSKFNLEIFTKIGESFDSTFLVNIVLPEFAEHSFRNLEKTTSEIIIASVQGVKYEYKYKGFSHTTVILPFGELQIILATGDGSKQYLDEFNQILSTFKFLE